MSIIVPAGNKNVDWSPKEEKMTKTASIVTATTQEEVNPLYEAALKFSKASEDQIAAPVAKDDNAPVIEIETPEGEKKEEEGKDKVEQAVEKLEEVVVDLKDAVGEVSEAEEVEVEIEVEDESPAASDVAMPSIPGKDMSKDEIVIESTPGSTCASAEKKNVEMNKAAATEEEFCRFAKLTPANRKKLGDYWVNMLGFPKDYVALMTKDFEK
jgi:hypothetical protein